MHPLNDVTDHYTYGEKMQGLASVLPDLFSVDNSGPEYRTLQRRDTYPANKRRPFPPASWHDDIFAKLTSKLATVNYPNRMPKPDLLGDRSYHTTNVDIPATHAILDPDYTRFGAKPPEFMSIREGRITELEDDLRQLYDMSTSVFWLLMGYHKLLPSDQDAAAAPPQQLIGSTAESITLTT